MPEYDVKYSIDNHPCRYKVEGELAEPSERCLLLEDTDLTCDKPWNKQGYTTLPAWTQEFSRQLEAGAASVLSDAMEAICQRKTDIAPERYHTAVSNEEHYALIDWLKKLTRMADRYFPLDKIDAYISDALGMRVTSRPKHLDYAACWLRIVRPQCPDNNPLHRDVWLDRLRNGINIYVPMAGSNALSSLSLIPGSHYWKESELTRTSDAGSTINGVTFTVSSVTGSKHGLSMIRPPLRDNEIMLFSPYLVHGGACNLNQDMTRISLEMRFWKP